MLRFFHIDKSICHARLTDHQNPQKAEKMSAESEKESPQAKAEDFEIKIVPEGTFAGHIDKPEIVKKGEVIPEDTGDQGGGQS